MSRLIEAPNSSGKARTFFDQQAETYSDFYDPATQSGAAVLFRMRAAIASDMILKENASPLLDLATGTGEITLQVATAAGVDEVTLNDFSEPMLRRCKQTFEPLRGRAAITLCNRDAFQLLSDLPANKFRAILCLGLIAHTGRLVEILQNCHRLLLPGGVVILQSSLNDHPGVLLTSLYAGSPVRRTSHLHHPFRLSEIQSAVARTGFDVVEARRFGVCLPFGDKLLGRLNFLTERRYAAQMHRFGGEVVLKIRRT